MDKIILITYLDKGIRLVSHGINAETLETVLLPPESLSYFDYTYDKELDAFVLKDG
jgi:hypothetical protein